MIHLAPHIHQIPAVSQPLSADAFIIEGDAQYYVFDVGSSDGAYAAIAALEKPVTVILSHFHRDHIANMNRLCPAETLAGARTLKYIASGTLVDAPLTICDGVEILVQPCVSPHAPGCLIATVDGMYTLIGDLHYSHHDRGQGEAKGMLNLLRSVNTQYFVPSHQERNPLVPRDLFLQQVKEHFQL